ncbi:MAG TPA: cell wall-binding repeat-containing protein [Nitriliruptorales bacterium]
MIVVTSLLASGLVALAGGAARAEAVKQVSVGDFWFQEQELTVREGDTVVWRWVGEDAHSVTASPPDEETPPAFDSGVRYKGADFAVTFDEPGVVPYFCVLHGSPDGEGMTGTIKVLPADGEALPEASDNVAAAISWSQSTNEDGGADTVLLGRSDVFADSLASGSLQGELDAPLLLTQTDSLDARVDAELVRLGAKRVIILGGEAAISKAVEDALVAKGYGVQRIGGIDRIATAFFVAQQYFGRSDAAIVARAFGPGTSAFADALGAGAAGAKMGIPVLLTRTESLSPTVKDYLEKAGVTTVYIAGGEAAISEGVADALEAMGIEVIRLGGEDRFGTADLFTEFTFTFEESKALVVDGAIGNTEAWASGFTAAQAAGQGGLLIVANGDEVNLDIIYQFLMELLPAVVCGPGVAAVVCDAVVLPTTVPSFDMAEQLLGWADTPTDASVDGTNALFQVRPTSDPTVVCFDWFGEATMDVVASHIHRASDSVAVIDTGAGTADVIGENGVYGCGQAIVPGAAADLFANPGDYYLNLHFDGTTETVRGDMLRDPSDIWFIGVDASLETGGGHPGAGGFGVAFPDTDAPDTICVGYFSFIFGETGPVPLTGAHIHEGDNGEDGPVVVPLPTPDEGEIVASGCTDTDEVGTDTAVVDAIAADINGHYVNLHTEDYPDGAARGQLIDFLPPYEGEGGGMGPASFRAAATR